MMLSSFRNLAGFALVLFGMHLPACGSSHRCGTAEVCNYKDDNCNAQVDETFRDEGGIYNTVAHCGACETNCDTIFSSAKETACVVSEADHRAHCEIISCPDGTTLSGTGSCVPSKNVLCLPCSQDGDCNLTSPGSKCVSTSQTEKRCSITCENDTGCPTGFFCATSGAEKGQCMPTSGYCGCSAETPDVELACLIETSQGRRCAGTEQCGVNGPGKCLPALSEVCNGQDDDCDGRVDEDFRDAQNRYVAPLHCGGCNQPCVTSNPNMVATCAPDAAPISHCVIACAEGYSNPNGAISDGCECRVLSVGGGPPVGIQSDANCNPNIDLSQYIFVSPAGLDSNAGTQADPVRTLQRAIVLAEPSRKTVLAARGNYEGPVQIAAGVNVYGGYSPDFGDRNLELYPVLIERDPVDAGLPALICTNIAEATKIDGIQVAGTDALTSGQGSTAVYLDRCSEAVSFNRLTVFASRGADGQRGRDSTARLTDWGISSLGELGGVSGTAGSPGTPTNAFCATVAAGVGGPHTCIRGASSLNVSGGNGGAAACPSLGCTNGFACGNAGCTDFTPPGGTCNFTAVLASAVSNPLAIDGRGVSHGVAGRVSYNSPTNRGVCNFCDDNPSLRRSGESGSDGASGADGAPGLGCGGALIFDSATARVHGASGMDANDGADGSGGGGGSAGAGYAVIGATATRCTSLPCADNTCHDQSGGSGGGGGSGGCGAPGATAGLGGGASIGIAIVLRAGAALGPAITNTRIVTSSGGSGGDGGIGAGGGAGGAGGDSGGGQHWCARSGGRGGDGGRGGAGGGGGGGCGGGSHGIFIAQSALDVSTYQSALQSGVEVNQVGIAGAAGRGGFSPGHAGTDAARGSSSTIFVQH